MAVGTPLLIGIAAADPAAGATACVGAYVAAFTNKGGPRLPRTVGLLASAAINTVAFGVGGLTATLFPVDLAILAVLVFIAAMDDTFGATAARCGTMPATAFLAGIAATSVHSLAIAVALVACGGLWYAAATMLLTPAPRLRQISTSIGLLYRQIAVLLAEHSGRGTADHADLAIVLRQAEDAVVILAGPGGDDALAEEARELVGTAAALIDSIAALDSAGAPDPAITPEYQALAAELCARLTAVAATLTDGAERRSLPDTALDDFILAVERLRNDVIDGSAPYKRLAGAAQLRRRMIAINEAVDTATEHATNFGRHPNLRLPTAVSAAVASVTPHGVRAAFTLTSTTYRHALRATLISSALFAVVVTTHLPHGEWAILAALRVLRPQYGATAQRASQRVIGNVIGGTCAAVAIAWIHSPAVLAVAVFVIICVGFALRPINYAFWVVFGTPLILLIGDLTNPGDWHAALGRIAMTLVGSAAALVGYYLILPDWDINRLPDQLDQAILTTADYLDVVLNHVADPHPATGNGIQHARHTAEAALGTATETLHRAQREPRHSETRTTASTLEALSALQTQLAGLIALPATRSEPIPYLQDYRRLAVPAIRETSVRTGAEDTSALGTSVEQMHHYLSDLHAQRMGELIAQPDTDTPLRKAIRENQPVIDQLARIAETIDALASNAADEPTRAR